MHPVVVVVDTVVVVRRTTVTSRCFTRCERRTTSHHYRQVETFNLLLHDDMRAMNAAGSKQGRGPGGVEIDLPGGGAVEGSGRLRGSKKT
jgi:hypothetical protein